MNSEDLLRAALLAAKEKLAAYYADTGGRYPGGPLYGDLMRQIDEALAFKSPAPSRASAPAR